MNEKDISLFLGGKFEDIKMGNEEMYGKYPTIHLIFENAEISFPINEEGFNKIKEFLSHIFINYGRWSSDGNDKEYARGGLG